MTLVVVEIVFGNGYCCREQLFGGKEGKIGNRWGC
jgi:hypothetical protein